MNIIKLLIRIKLPDSDESNPHDCVELQIPIGSDYTNAKRIQKETVIDTILSV